MNNQICIYLHICIFIFCWLESLSTSANPVQCSTRLLIFSQVLPTQFVAIRARKRNKKKLVPAWWKHEIAGYTNSLETCTVTISREHVSSTFLSTLDDHGQSQHFWDQEKGIPLFRWCGFQANLHSGTSIFKANHLYAGGSNGILFPFFILAKIPKG